MEPDYGRELVDHLRAILGVDAAFVREESAGFRWWPWRLPQRIWAERAANGEHVRVHAESALLRGVAGGGAVFAALSDAFVRDPGLSALRWNGDGGDVTLHASVTLGPDPDRLGFGRAAALLAHAALLQLGDAERFSTLLSIALGAAAAESAPPGVTRRAEPDPLLEAGDLYALRGSKDPPWNTDVLRAFATLADPPWTRVNVGGESFDAQLAAPAAADAANAPGSLALFRLSGSQRHPRLGAGLLAMLQPPAALEPVLERRHATAALLNEAEAREWLPTQGLWTADALGGWCVHPQHGLAHVAFHPALADRPDLLEAIARGAALRAAWAGGFLAKVDAFRDARGT